MTLRTVEIYGMGFGESPAEVSATLNGNVIFSGTVPTQNVEPWALPDLSKVPDTVPLFNFTIPLDASGEMPMTCQVTSGTIIFANILANYSAMANPVFSAAEMEILQSLTTTRIEKVAVLSAHASPQFTAEEITFLQDTNPALRDQQDLLAKEHGVAVDIPSGPTTFSQISYATDCRNDVFIDGVPVTPDHSDLPGSWWWKIGTGSTLSYNLDVSPSWQ